MVQWYVKELSKLTKISSRTLHHYDKINLLKPSIRLDNGYRLYTELDLLKLQRIIALKYFGFDLSNIKIILQKNTDMLAYFQDQSKFLQAEVNKLTEASKALELIIRNCSKDKSIPWEIIIKLIEVFNMENKLNYVHDSEKQKQYEQYVIENNIATQDQMINANKVTENYETSDWEAMQKEMGAINKELIIVLLNELQPDFKEVQNIIRKHHQLVCKFWTPDKDSYVGLAEMYLSHEDFRKYYDSYHPKLLEFLVASMKVYAEQEL